ncbi:MAG: hypothetical protein A2499_04910 [Stygiobacter sp. RIFOXYC12_FULL_38_8]|nr:MAG: hypothetical protein A2299_16280 [Stygiobacter sp. RIFOXYB2_FULL_37_11]OGV13465.1 MAG: hypothetical protein A2237_16975 [Stygiobacter sp. RIFOXYA2_FULL_38_8]OGV14756.1 MAG: hypothetical protein A2440_09660 [Stygiobacter sp. RIFOXYC2_FULL_38_25]OGV22292.1 MAG: hypothetical protein A2499_04910 [Stygiobacter sp. RIFOXYC12_FULL_38_8]OGV79249.1 MAG: hypothetical protein A2X65_02030 [Stygiobacter sp. GWF2_38_21]
MTLTEWKDATRQAILSTASCFKPKEIDVLFDFLETVTEDDLNKTPHVKKENDSEVANENN